MTAVLDEASASELPPHWGWQRLGELTEECRRGRPPAYDGRTTLVVNQKCVRPGMILDLTHAKRTNEASKAIPDWAVLKAGDILVNSTGTGTLGRTALLAAVPERVTADTHVTIVRPRRDVVSPAFVALYLHSLQARLEDMSAGSTNQRELRPADLADILVPLLPLHEQEQIVGVVEELMAQIAEGERQFQSAIDAADKYRAAVLRDAFRGLDTEPLAQSCEFVTDGDHNPPKRQPSGVPHLTAKNVRDGTLDLSNATYIDPVDFERVRKRYQPQAGDVIVTCVGTIGRVGIVPEGVLFSPDRNLAGLRCLPSVMPEFLAAALNSPSLQQLMREASGSTAQPHLYLGDLRALPVPVASPSEQRVVVQTLGSQLAAIDGLRNSVRAQQRGAQRLTRAVLRDAMWGKLTSETYA